MALRRLKPLQRMRRKSCHPQVNQNQASPLAPWSLSSHHQPRSPLLLSVLLAWLLRRKQLGRTIVSMHYTLRLGASLKTVWEHVSLCVFTFLRFHVSMSFVHSSAFTFSRLHVFRPLLCKFNEQLIDPPIFSIRTAQADTLRHPSLGPCANPVLHCKSGLRWPTRINPMHGAHCRSYIPQWYRC